MGGGEEELPLNDGRVLIQHLMLDTRHVIRSVRPPHIHLYTVPVGVGDTKCGETKIPTFLVQFYIKLT